VVSVFVDVRELLPRSLRCESQKSRLFGRDDSGGQWCGVD
jgi:hypothetical protein